MKNSSAFVLSQKSQNPFLPNLGIINQKSPPRGEKLQGASALLHPLARFPIIPDAPFLSASQLDFFRLGPKKRQQEMREKEKNTRELFIKPLLPPHSRECHYILQPTSTSKEVKKHRSQPTLGKRIGSINPC